MDKVSKAAERFKVVRAALGLTQQQLADALFLSRNYVAKIESEKKEPSVRALNALEALLAKHGHTESGPGPHVVLEEARPYGTETAASLRKKIRLHHEQLLAAAGDDLQRLGWIAEQMEHHLSEPVNWGVHERVIKQVLEERRKKDEKAAAEKAAQPSRRSTSEGVA